MPSYKIEINIDLPGSLEDVQKFVEEIFNSSLLFNENQKKCSLHYDFGTEYYDDRLEKIQRMKESIQVSQKY